MTHETWKARGRHVVRNDGYLTTDCVADAYSLEDAARIAREHNTHAALVEALGVARDAILQLSQVLGMGTIASEAIDKADAAIAAAKVVTP
jgi:hypothetical protein